MPAPQTRELAGQLAAAERPSGRASLRTANAHGTSPALELHQLRRDDVLARGGGLRRGVGRRPRDLRPLRARGLGRLRRQGDGRARRLRHRGRLRPPVRRAGPGDPRGRRDHDGRRQHLPAARLPLRPRRDRQAEPPRARGRDPLRGRLRRHQRRLPDDPHHQRHADLPSPELRRARAGPVPDQPPLHRPRPGLDVHGRDARGAHRRVPRGERLPGPRAVRGFVAARQRRVGRGRRRGPACSSAPACHTYHEGLDVSGLLHLTPAFDGGRRPRPGGQS